MPKRTQPSGNKVYRHVLKGANYISAGVLGAVAVSFFYFHELVMGLMTLGFALLVGIWQRELAIDLVRHRYRFADYMLGVSFSSWHPLPLAERVMIRQYTGLTGRHTDSGTLEYMPESTYLVLLSVTGQLQAVELHRTSEYAEALRLGYFLGSVLSLPVLGYDRDKREELLQEVE